MSGHPIAEDAELVGGVVDAALLKPLDLTQLLSLVAALMAGRPPSPA